MFQGPEKKNKKKKILFLFYFILMIFIGLISLKMLYM